MVQRIRATDESVRAYRESVDHASIPSVSVIVPVHRDPAGVRDTVTSLQRAPYPDGEVIAVVTPGSGETRAVLEELAADDEELTVLTETAHETPGSGRNVGIEAATGDVVAFVDADMRVERDFRWRLAYAFEESSVDYLGYPVAVGGDGRLDGIVARYDRRLRFPVEALMEQFWFSPTCALAVRDEVLGAGLRFDPRLDGSEDVVFGHRVARAGFQFGYCPDVDVSHPVRGSLREIFSKARKDGRGWYQMYTYLPDQHLHRRSRVLSSRGYRPPPLEYLRSAFDDWSELPRRERAAIFGLSLFESLGATCGWLLEAAVGDWPYESGAWTDAPASGDAERRTVASEADDAADRPPFGPEPSVIDAAGGDPQASGEAAE